MIFSTRRVFIVVLFLGLFLMTLRPIADPDFWWHLRTGQLIAQTHSIPHIDPFSFTKTGATWITHEWLSELLIYALFITGGYGFLIIFFSAIITTAFFFSYLRCPTDTRPYVAGFVLLLASISSAPTWGVRPQMISLLLTSLFIFLLDGYRREGKLIFLIPLPLITLVWVNLHAGYLLGLSLIFINICGSLTEILLAEFQKNRKNAKLPTIKSIFTQVCMLFACILAALANPNGIKIILYPFQTLTSPSMQMLIQEWFSPDFHQMMWQPFALLILVIIGAGMVSRKPISPTNILLSLVLGYSALRSMRNVPLFAIAIIPVLSDQVGSLLKLPTDQRAPSRLFRIMTSILILGMVLVTSLRIIQVVREQPITEADNFPKASVDWLLANRPKGSLYNSYGWGGYLIWRLYPIYQVYIDGRADVYGDKFIFDYTGIYHLENNWENQLIDHSIRVVLIESECPSRQRITTIANLANCLYRPVKFYFYSINV